jgi:L-iditol 2-dehydrogenase
MKVAVYYSNNDLRIEEVPTPVIAEGEILVQMMASGICGTDVMEWYRIKKAPRVLGHEMAGRVVEIGASVETFKKDDRVFVSHHVPCFNCHRCRQGNYTACDALHTGNYEPGGFSEFIRVPEQNVRYGTFLLPENISYDEATMIEPLACAIAGQNQLYLSEGQTVLVLGSGISGLLHIQLAKLRGARVIATDINSFRLEKALEFGADDAVKAAKYTADKLKSLNNGRLADRVVVCAGAEEVVGQALTSVDKKGTILFFAVPEKDIAIPSVRFWRDEISITFSYGAAPADLENAIALIESGSLNIASMITHRIALSHIQDGFRLVSSAKDSLKVVILPD